TAAEILGQVLRANAVEHATHLVFMGMGEPLANYAEVVKTLKILTDAKLGLGYSPRRITVSTVGLVTGIEKLGRENLKVNLAISLHAASDEVRSRLMPVNRAWRLYALMAALRRYPPAPRPRVFFGHDLLNGLSGRHEVARRQSSRVPTLNRHTHAVAFGAAADVVVVNSCTVTARAEVSDRQAIRRARRANPDARVVVTGGWAQTSDDEVAREAGVDLVVGNADKERLPALLDEILEG